MITSDWRPRTDALALAFVREAMTAAGIDHSHVDDAHLSVAIQKSSLPVWVLDEEGARELVDDCNYYDYTLMQARRSEEMRKTTDPLPTLPRKDDESGETPDF
jgi:hypothetical protein